MSGGSRDATNSLWASHSSCHHSLLWSECYKHPVTTLAGAAVLAEPTAPGSDVPDPSSLQGPCLDLDPWGCSCPHQLWPPSPSLRWAPVFVFPRPLEEWSSFISAVSSPNWTQACSHVFVCPCVVGTTPVGAAQGWQSISALRWGLPSETAAPLTIDRESPRMWPGISGEQGWASPFRHDFLRKKIFLPALRMGFMSPHP